MIVGVVGLLGLLLLIMRRETRLAGAILLIQSIITLALFARTQDFGMQHYYLLVPAISLGIAAVVIRLCTPIAHQYWRAISVGLLFTVLLGNSSIVFTPRAVGLSQALGSLAPKVYYYPLIRNDIDVLDALLDHLGQLQVHKGGDIYVLASSTILNGNILQNHCRLTSRRRPFCNRILDTND